MKTFKQFVEVFKKPIKIKIEKPKKPKKVKKGPSTTPATDGVKIKHASQRDALADRGKADKVKQSIEFQQMVSTQKGEIDKAKKSDKSAGLRKSADDKRKKQQVAAADKRKKQQAKKK